MAAVGLRELHGSVAARRARHRHAMAVAPVEAPELHLRTGHGCSRAPGGRGHDHGVTGDAMHEHEVAHQKVHALKVVLVVLRALEVGARGGHHDVEPGFVERRRHERAMHAEVGRGGEVHGPVCDRCGALHQRRDLLPAGQEVVVPGGLQPAPQAHRVRAEMKLRKVAVLHLHRPLPRAVEHHGRELISRRFDLRDDRTALLATDRRREGRFAGLRDRARAYQCVGRVLFFLDEPGEQRLPDGPPFEVAQAAEPLLQVVADGLAIFGVRERGVKSAQPFEARLQGRLPSPAGEMPLLEVVEQRGQAHQRMGAGVVALRLQRA
jgi:hypothetical protein